MPTSPPETPIAWCDGNLLVLSRAHPVAPHRCCLSNQSVVDLRRMKVLLGWTKDEEMPLPIPAALKLIIKLVELANFRLFTIDVAISEREAQKRFRALCLNAGMFAAGAALLAYGVSLGAPRGGSPHFEFMLPGVILGIASITLFANRYALFHVVSMDAKHIWIRGAGAAFLESLPSFEDRDRGSAR